LQNLKPGGPGRKRGVLNRTTREIRDAAKGIVEDPDYLANLTKRVAAGKAPHMETLLFYYAYGKPKELVEHSGAVQMPAQVIFELHRTA
jgi:hypothetical protein